MKKRFPYYPIYIDIEDRNVLIVGGGTVCARKAKTMMRYGGRVTVVSPRISDEIATWERDGALAVRHKTYGEADLDGASIVIASTDDTCVTARAAIYCRRPK